MKIKLPNREIGDGCDPYIIAEVGSNWESFQDCIDSIVSAKQCGVDAVKFQLFTQRDLYGWDAGLFVSQESMIGIRPWLDPQWLPKLKEKADAVGIDFMCTAFSPEGYDIVNPYVSIHKVASAEATHLRILQKVKSLGKPVILSTGAKNVEDIKMSLEVLGRENTILMYCVSAYPATNVDLYSIQNMNGLFKCLVGYSDHTVDSETIPPLSTAHGACVLEKHFKVREMNTPDAPHSIDPDRFKRMVFCVKNKKYPEIRTTASAHEELHNYFPEEKPMVLRHNRRLIVTKDIKPGDTLKEGENFGIYRSLKDDTRAAHPFMVDWFNGKTAKVEMKAGDGLWKDDVL